MVLAVVLYGANPVSSGVSVASLPADLPRVVFPLRDRSAKELKVLMSSSLLPREFRLHVLERLVDEIRGGAGDPRYPMFVYMLLLQEGMETLGVEDPEKIGTSVLELRELQRRHDQAVSTVFEQQAREQGRGAVVKKRRHWCATCALANERARRAPRKK